MSLTTPSKLRELQIKLYRQAKNWAPPSAIARHASIRSGISASSSAECRWNPVRESAVKPVGKPDAGNPHVRFDERGWETGRRSGVSARAHPRLYKLTVGKFERRQVSGIAVFLELSEMHSARTAFDTVSPDYQRSD